MCGLDKYRPSTPESYSRKDSGIVVGNAAHRVLECPLDHAGRFLLARIDGNPALHRSGKGTASSSRWRILDCSTAARSARNPADDWTASIPTSNPLPPGTRSPRADEDGWGPRPIG